MMAILIIDMNYFTVEDCALVWLNRTHDVRDVDAQFNRAMIILSGTFMPKFIPLLLEQCNKAHCEICHKEALFSRDFSKISSALDLPIFQDHPLYVGPGKPPFTTSFPVDKT